MNLTHNYLSIYKGFLNNEFVVSFNIQEVLKMLYYMIYFVLLNCKIKGSLRFCKEKGLCKQTFFSTKEMFISDYPDVVDLTVDFMEVQASTLGGLNLSPLLLCAVLIHHVTGSVCAVCLYR